MRSLSEQRLIHSLDYLSTVSGGGYAGAILCSLFVPNDLRGPAPLPAKETEIFDEVALDVANDEPSDVEDGSKCDVFALESGRTTLARLRQGGHYLAPNGTSDALFAAVIVLRNWFALAITAGISLLAFFYIVNSLALLTELLLEKAPDFMLHLQIPKGPNGPWQLALIGMALWPVSCAWAYWFTRSGIVPLSRVVRLVSMQTIAAIFIFTITFFWPNREGLSETLRDIIQAIALMSLTVYALAEFVSFWRDWRAGAKRAAKNFAEALAQEDRVRDRLSRWLLRGVIYFCGTATVGALFWISREPVWAKALFRDVGIDGRTLGLAALATGVLVISARLVLSGSAGAAINSGRRSAAVPRVRQVLAVICGLALLFALLSFWATMAGGTARWIISDPARAWKHTADIAPWLADGTSALLFWLFGTGLDSRESATLFLFMMSAMVGLAAYLIGNVDSLLNRSSFSAFYSSRLRSAYLGATNQRRQRLVANSTKEAEQVDEGAVPLDRDDPNDEITLAAYYSKIVMAPIHLINVTINETTSSSSRVIQRDRKGKSMTIAPSGYLYPPRSPAESLAILRRRDAEDLPLSSWIAISGAAFTTGAGQHTSLGTSMLATLTNMRLGYWWNSRDHSRRWPFRRPGRLVQAYLLRELRGSYKGTAGTRWYLSDGGHYENTGVYELVRRRVGFIIASDNGADPLYEFGDLVNLMRKVRIDFDTEIEFLDEAELNAAIGNGALRDVFGSLDDIRLSGKQETKAAADSVASQRKAGPYATLARIKYPKSADQAAQVGTLLLIKPRITGRELPDLIQYRDMNTAFPQQPTTNQFFDEAQWESYYRLGQLIGDTIFKKDRFQDEAVPPSWVPWRLEPLDPCQS
jgi:hypothetical protein